MKIPPPVAELLGIEFVSAGDGLCTMKLEAEERHSNPMGTLHGGIVCDLVDAALGMAFFSTGTLVAHGKVVHRGKTVGMTECDVADDQGRLIARASSTCLALRGEAAEGR